MPSQREQATQKRRCGRDEKQNMTLSQEEPEQIGSFKNSRWEIPACSGRKLRVNGRAKVPAERSGLIPRLEKSFSDMPRFSLATASLRVTGSSLCRLTAVICNNLIFHLHLKTSYVQLLYTSGQWFWPFDPPAWGARILRCRCKSNSLPLVFISSSSGWLKMQIETSAHAARLLVFMLSLNKWKRPWHKCIIRKFFKSWKGGKKCLQAMSVTREGKGGFTV